MSKALPLKGIRVVNFGWVWAGPVVGQTLSFLGAEVYKIESYARVDLTRNLPPYAEGKPDPNRSLSNHACWAGNGSVSLNLKEPEALQLVKDLIAVSDVVVENFGPGVMERLGLGYDVLTQLKKDIILFSMPGAGLYGPMKDLRSYGLSLTSTTGLDSLVGYKNEDPIPVENAYSDPYAGTFGTFAVVAALNHRRNTGEGQHIDFSQQEAVMQMVGPAYMDYQLNGRSGGPKGNEHPLAATAPHGVFPCQGEDRWLSLVVAKDEEWQGLLTAMNHPPELQTDDFASREARIRNIDRLHQLIAAWTAQFDDFELAEKLQSHGVAAAPVLNIADLYNNPHWQARKTFVEVEHPLGFKETIYGRYVKLSESAGELRPGPVIGQNNEYVFKKILGMSDERYDELVKRQIIY